jgi:D-serine deaminase-like pyridoxal phosphate-dependent protein
MHMSAEHCTLVLEVPNADPQVGQTLDFIVGYGDETVCLHNDLHGIRRGIIEAVWPIQGRGKFQ